MKKNLKLFLKLSLLITVIASCNPAQKTVQDSEVINDRILVLLKNRAQPAMLEKELSDYKLTNHGPTSRSENRWAFTFDTKIIKSKALLDKIRASEWVLEAEMAPLVKEPKINSGK